MSSKTFAVAISFLIVSQTSGCVWKQQGDFKLAEAQYQECMVDHPRDPVRCDGYRAERDASYERYEREAALQWGCRRTLDLCTPDPVP